MGGTALQPQRSSQRARASRGRPWSDRGRRSVALIAATVVLAACGSGDLSEDPPPDVDEPRSEAPDETPVTDPFEDFDREEARQDAEALLGLAEGDFDESPERRVVRRGDEEFAVTMDLRPGRQNVELDDDGTGTYVVTRVTVETPDGEDPIVVE